MRTVIFIPILWAVAFFSSFFSDKQRIKKYIYIENQSVSRFIITKYDSYYRQKVKKEHYNKLSYTGFAGYMLVLLYVVIWVFSICFFNDCSTVLLTKTLFYLALGIGALIMLLNFLNDGELWKKGIIAKSAAVFCDSILLIATVYFLRWVIIYYQILYMMKF